MRISTIDAEVAGEALRLIVSGGPSVPGRTMVEKLVWLRKHGEALRTKLMLEPRGHAGMHGAMLTEPVSANAHGGLLAMHAGGFPILSGEAVIAAVTIGLEHQLITSNDDELIIDTPAGQIRATPGPAEQPRRVTITLPASFVHAPGVAVQIGNRTIAVDVAFGGEFYAIVDSEAVGIPVDVENEAPLTRMAFRIKDAIEAAVSLVHPHDRKARGLHGTIFTGSATGTADLRSATVLDGRVLRRSPGAAGTAALLAVLDAMGLVADGVPFTHEGVLGTKMIGVISTREREDERAMVIPAIEGSASITGFHEFVW